MKHKGLSDARIVSITHKERGFPVHFFVNTYEFLNPCTQSHIFKSYF